MRVTGRPATSPYLTPVQRRHTRLAPRHARARRQQLYRHTRRARQSRACRSLGFKRARRAQQLSGGTSASQQPPFCPSCVKMALSRATGLLRRALPTQRAVVRLLSSVGAGGEPIGGDVVPGRQIDTVALRRERALRPPSAQPPSAPPQPHHSSANLGRSTGWTVQLNAQIQACVSAEAVLDLVTPLLERLNYVNASTALITVQKRASDLAAVRRMRRDARFAKLLETAARVFERMEPRNLSNSLYACGKLGIVPPADWLQRYWHVSASKMGEFRQQNFSNTLYACGELDIAPPADWLQRFWHASASQLGDFVPQGLRNTVYA